MEGLKSPTPLRLVGEILRLRPTRWFHFIFGTRLKLMSDEEFMFLLREGWSLYRWGDGETAIARGKSISYQIEDPILEGKLKKLVKSHHPATIHGLSWALFSSLFDSRWRTRKLFRVMFSTKVFLSQNHKVKQNNKYIETQVWYTRKNIQEDLQSIIGTRPCLLVASKEEYLQALPSQTSFLNCPSKNAFQEYEVLNSSIEEWLQYNSTGEKPCILTACGPTSKALVLDFRDRCQVIDIGHGFNFYLFGFGVYAWKMN